MIYKEWKYLSLIIIIFIAACIETDIYLPAFTDMMAFFSISEDKIQSLLTWNFIGICLSGPFYGPLSDSLGRKKPLLFALGLFLIGSIITVAASDFNFMLIGRILQGLGSGGCFTLGTTIIFDVFQEENAVLALNKINTIVPVIMAAAPMIGAYLNQTYGFRSNFVAITVSVLVSFMTCLFFFEETLAIEKRVPFKLKKLMGDFKKVAMSLPFWQATLIVSLIFAGYLTFLSCISVLFVIELGVSKQELPFHQIALLGSWVGASLTYKKSMAAWGIKNIKAIGTCLFVLGGLSFFIAAWLSPENIYVFTGSMMVYTIGANWINGIYFPEGMELFPDIKGISASLMTSARLLITALVVIIGSSLYDSTINPMAAILLGLVVTILIVIVLYEKNRNPRLDNIKKNHTIESI